MNQSGVVGGGGGGELHNGRDARSDRGAGAYSARTGRRSQPGKRLDDDHTPKHTMRAPD